MFHGTSSVFIDSILSNGLLCNPPRKTWSDGFYKSLEGVYFSFNLEQALFFAKKTTSIHGGNLIVAVAEIENKDAIPDEDNISRLIKWSADLSYPKYQIKNFENNFFRLMQDIEGVCIDDEIKKELKDILPRVLKLEINRNQDDTEIVKYYDLISRKLKSCVLECKKPVHNKSFRVIKDIKITNQKNRLLCLTEIVSNKVKVVYGQSSIPMTMLFQLRKILGNFEIA